VLTVYPAESWAMRVRAHEFSTIHTLPEAEIMGLSDGEEIMTLWLFRFDTIPAVTDEQTHRRTRRCRKDPLYA